MSYQSPVRAEPRRAVLRSVRAAGAPAATAHAVVPGRPAPGAVLRPARLLRPAGVLRPARLLRSAGLLLRAAGVVRAAGVLPDPDGGDAPPAPSSGAATASLIFGIVGIVGGWCLLGLPCLLAVIFGHIGLAATRDNRMQGRGLAVAGLVLGYICVIPAILLTVWILGAVVFASQSATTTGY